MRGGYLGNPIRQSVRRAAAHERHMIHRTRMPSLEQVYEVLEDSRYLDERDPDHEAYNAMGNRLHAFHLTPEKWPGPERFQLGRPLAPRFPVGTGGANHAQDVAELSDGLLSLGGLGLSGWLPRTHVPNSKLNAAIVGFQRLNRLTPDGLVNPDGPTIKVLNGYLPLPQAQETVARVPTYEAAALNQPPEAAQAEAEMEAERRAEDPFGDIFGGRRYERNHIDDMLDSFEAETRAQLDREALAGLDPNAMMTEVGYRPNGQAVFGPMGVPGAVFRKAISDAERSHLEQVGGGYGLYQLTPIALRDIGLWDENNEWSGQWGIDTAADFLTSLALQDRALTLYMKHNDQYLHGARNTLDVFDYRGQMVMGLEGNFRITPVGFMAAAHRRGHGDVRAYIRHQEENGWVSDFDGLDGDWPEIFKQIETRLRTFENVPYVD